MGTSVFQPHTHQGLFIIQQLQELSKNIVMNAVKAGFPPEAGPPSAEKSASILPNELKLILHNFRKELVNEGNTKEPKT